VLFCFRYEHIIFDIEVFIKIVRDEI